MGHPIYLLQLSDWHLTREICSNKPFEQSKDIMFHNVKAFLKSRGKSVIDILAVTGDMMDKNGLKEDHTLAAEFVNEVKRELLDTNSKLYVSPGNHDCFEKMTSDVLKADPYCSSYILQQKWIPNYHIVDRHVDELKKSFARFSEFADAVNAENKANPFNDYGIIDLAGDARIFISWFNTSWLSNRGWKELNGPIYPFDYENLSVGDVINQHIYDAFESFKSPQIEKDPSEITFSMSLFHHYPRLLNLHDKFSIEKDKNVELNAKRLEAYNTRKDVTEHESAAYYCPKHRSFYDRMRSYDLVLNGHTHGKLFDPPFYTSPGGYTPESEFLLKTVSVIEIDLCRNFYLIHELPLTGKMKTASEVHTIQPKMRVFNDGRFVGTIRSNYDSEDFYNDRKYNGRLQHTGTTSNKELLVNLERVANIKDKSVDEMTKDIILTKKDNIQYPLLMRNYRKEMFALKDRT